MYVKGLTHAWQRASVPKVLTTATLTTLPSSSTHHAHAQQQQFHDGTLLNSQGFPLAPLLSPWTTSVLETDPLIVQDCPENFSGQVLG